MKVNVDLLKAAIFCAPVKADIRYYLNSVLVECAGYDYKVVATDGHILGCFTGKNESDLVASKFLIPIDAVKLAVKTKQLNIELSESSLGNVIYKPVDGVFPDYNKVMPAKFEPSMGNFNPELVMRGFKAIKQIHGNAQLIQNGMNAGIIKSTGNDIVVIMPLSVNDKITY